MAKKIIITEGGKIGFVWGVNTRNTSLEFNNPEGEIDPVKEELEVYMNDEDWDKLRTKKDNDAVKEIDKMKKTSKLSYTKLWPISPSPHSGKEKH